MPGETVQQIVQARRAAEESAREIEAERRSQDKLAGQVAGLAKQTAETEQKLTTVVSLLNERVKRLEGDNGNKRTLRRLPVPESPLTLVSPCAVRNEQVFSFSL